MRLPETRRRSLRLGSMVSVLLLASCAVADEPVPIPVPIDPGDGVACTMEYNPVCGERAGERRTFGNACTANAEGYVIVSQGECPPQSGADRICTREYRPVCAQRGSDVRTFGNACVAEADGYRILREGEC